MAHNAKSYTLVASSNSMADIMTALITHFTTAPGHWALKGSTAAAGFLIEEKIDANHVISIRRDGTAGWSAQQDANGSTATTGTASSSAGGMSSDASPELNHDLSGHSETFFVTEYVDAITILFQNSIKSFFLSGLHAGNCYVPMRSGWSALGLTGHMILMGKPEKSDSANYWMGDTNPNGQANGLIRAGNGSTKWFSVGTDNLLGASINTDGGTLPGDALVPPYILYAGNIGGVNYSSAVGLAKYIAKLSRHQSGNFTVIPNRSVLAGAVDGWLGFEDNTTSTDDLIAWERTHVLS